MKARGWVFFFLERMETEGNFVSSICQRLGAFSFLYSRRGRAKEGGIVTRMLGSCRVPCNLYRSWAVTYIFSKSTFEEVGQKQENLISRPLFSVGCFSICPIVDGWWRTDLWAAISNLAGHFVGNIDERLEKREREKAVRGRTQKKWERGNAIYIERRTVMRSCGCLQLDRLMWLMDFPFKWVRVNFRSRKPTTSLPSPISSDARPSLLYCALCLLVLRSTYHIWLTRILELVFLILP